MSRLSTLLKLAELKAADKKSTLLHYTVDTVQRNAPRILRVVDLHPLMSAAARVELDELRKRKEEVERGLDLVDNEITLVAQELLKEREQRMREMGEGAAEPLAADEDCFEQVLTEFWNWAAVEREQFENELDEAASGFRSVCTFYGVEKVS